LVLVVVVGKRGGVVGYVQVVPDAVVEGLQGDGFAFGLGVRDFLIPVVKELGAIGVG